jgi:hypothetical protein
MQKRHMFSIIQMQSIRSFAVLAVAKAELFARRKATPDETILYVDLGETRPPGFTGITIEKQCLEDGARRVAGPPRPMVPGSFCP